VWRNNKTGEIKEKYGLVSGVYIHSKPGEERFMEVSANLAGTVSKHKKQGKPFEIQKDGQLSWLMLKNRYFSMVLRPLEPCSGYFTRQSPSGVIIAGPSAQEFNIPANSSVTHKFGLYLGPSDLSLLKASDLGAESALSYGIFGSISQLLISMLKFFHKIARNWGVAILLLTFIINLALLPLTRKSYKSMQEMQILQPKIEKLRKELKDNPQKLQREIMELYKKYKINPMGGCLPMLLQMPIFIALYNGLMGSVELRGAKFLWINDLSTPENIKMPFSLPLVGNSLNILPLLMLVAMYFQQKLSSKMASMAQTDEQRKQQQFMSVMMTVMFGFIFYNFPSGLVLYWFVNTVLMTAYQIIFTKPPKHAEEIA
jgi:YidC/Oxa1 family membrane protein insertase